MTEKDVYKKGVALLEEWEDVNYCEHSFKFKDEWLTDKEVVDLLNELAEENQQLRQILDIGKTNAKDIVDVLNIQQSRIKELSEENKELKKQMNRLYNYFMDWYSDEMGANQFSEMWGMVKEDERWDCE